MTGKKLYKSRSDRKISGVCGGLAAYLGVDATLVRLIWAIAAICAGTGLIAYIVCACIIPDEPMDGDGGYNEPNGN